MIEVTTMVVDHPHTGMVVSVYLSEDEALNDLEELVVEEAESREEPLPNRGNVVQYLCDRGYIISIDQHQLPIYEAPSAD